MRLPRKKTLLLLLLLLLLRLSILLSICVITEERSFSCIFLKHILLKMSVKGLNNTSNLKVVSDLIY